MKKNKVWLLVCSGLISVSLIGCGADVESEGRIRELENELEVYKEKNNEYKKELEKLTKEIEVIKKANEEKKKDKLKVKEEKKEAVKYNRYTNQRFGFSIDYPTYLKKGPEPTNMDGLEFRGNGAVLVASGSHNANGESVEDIYNEKLSYISGNITYKNKGKDFCVISWEENDRVYYEYTKVGTGAINKFLIEYPESEKKAYDEIVSHIYNSFKPGDLN